MDAIAAPAAKRPNSLLLIRSAMGPVSRRGDNLASTCYIRGVNLRYAMLADYTNVTSDGRMNILGVFDRIYAREFPAIHNVLHLPMSLETGPDDEGQTRVIAVQLIDADANIIAEMRGQIDFGIGHQVLNHVLVFNDLAFEEPGQFQFTVLFDDIVVHSIDLQVLRVE